MDFRALRSLALRAMVEAAGDDENEDQKDQEEEEKKKAKNNEEDTDENNEKENEEEPENEQEEPEPEAEEGDTDEEAEDPEDETETPDDGTEENPDTDTTTSDEGGDTPGGEGEDEFSLDPDGGDGEEEDLGPAPDGLPEADDDGSEESDTANEDGSEETNIQVNILKLSELDRALAKKTCFSFFMDLKAKIQANLSVIDQNETVIDPDIREKITDTLNTTAGQLDQFLEYKFPIMNFEEALQAYFIFVKDINTALEEVRNDGIVGKKSKHKNKESS